MENHSYRKLFHDIPSLIAHSYRFSAFPVMQSRIKPSWCLAMLQCFFKIQTLKKKNLFWNPASKISSEWFSKWVILSILPVIFCSEETKDSRQKDRQTDRKEIAPPLLGQSYSEFPGFIWQNPSSQLLLRWKPNSQRSTRTKVIQTTQETPSGTSS